MSWNVRLGWMLSPIISESGGRWCIAHLDTPALGKEQLCNHQPASRLGGVWMKLTVRVVCGGAFQLSCFFNHLKLDSNTQFLETKYIKKRQLTWFCWTTTDESDLQPPNEKTCTKSPGASLALCSNVMQRSRASRAQLRPEPGSRRRFHERSHV